ncbi:MAG: hypothetical protein HZB59_03705 [Ignavibacteriales bacterium]|nr:hypothetical protein [Ignavibacteriales bacterium]
MKSKLSHIAPFLVFFTILPALGFIYILGEKFKKEIPVTNERGLKVDLEAGFGNIHIEKGSANQLLAIDIDADLKKDLSEYIDYSNRDDIGYLSINTTDALKENRDKKKHSLHISGFEDNNWLMRFTDAVPISFDIELGMGKGEINLTGLQVKDLNLSTGASSVSLRFDEKNKTEIDNITIETGLSKFKAYGLSNANFDNLKFEGGVGSYLLDFSGKLQREVDVDIQIGLGSITIVIPDEIGAKVYYEKSWVASIDLPRYYEENEDNTYFSKNYYSAKGRLNFHIEAGLGSVTIKNN